jgi:hypothetical protein
MVDRDGDGLLDYQEFINLFMQKLEIWTSDRNSWFEELILKADLNSWFEHLIEAADLNSWFEHLIETADLNIWYKQLSWAADRNSWFEQLICRTTWSDHSYRGITMNVTELWRTLMSAKLLAIIDTYFFKTIIIRYVMRITFKWCNYTIHYTKQGTWLRYVRNEEKKR